MSMGVTVEELAAKFVAIQRWFIVDQGATRENIEKCIEAAALLVAVILGHNEPERRAIFNAAIDKAFDALKDADENAHR